MSVSSASPTVLRCRWVPSPHGFSRGSASFEAARPDNSGRKRVRARLVCCLPVQRSSLEFEDDSCQEHERKVYDEIDRYLGRSKGTAGRKIGFKSSGAKGRRPRKHHVDAEAHESPVTSRRSFHRILKGLEKHTAHGQQTLSSIAKDDRLLLKGKCHVDLDHASHKVLTSLLAWTQQLIALVKVGGTTDWEHSSSLSRSKDESFLANLEHLLLCLQSDVLQALSSQAWDLVHRNLIRWQKQQCKRCRDWFSEYPNSRRPLSTTWPWSIKPSLAILWGVCWMFYDREYMFDGGGNLIDVTGRIVMSRRDLEDTQYLEEGEKSMNIRLKDPNAVDVNDSAGRAAADQAATTQPPTSDVYNQAISLQDEHHSLGAAVGQRRSSTWPTTAAQVYSPAHATGSSEPLSDTYGRDARERYIQGEGEWMHQDPPPRSSLTTNDYSLSSKHSVQQSRSHDPVTPTVRLITDDGLLHATTPPPQGYINRFDSSDSQVNSETLSPQDLYMPLPLETTRETMQTPVSPRSRQGSVASSYARQRTFSNSSLSRSSPRDPGQRQTSVSAHSPTAFPVYRAEPRLNQHNKYFCDVSADCRDLTFDRKCEWSKHMDKHDRPYRCADPSCAKLQGFTYSGGLLRHEREVHGKHGGPRDRLRCPDTSCKRHTGKGFTRRENLNEHVRRVHGNATFLTASAAVKIADDASTSFLDRPDVLAGPVHLSISTGKRKREADDSLSERSDPDTDKETLREEIVRLKRDNEMQRERMTRMEAQMEEVLSQRR